MNVCPSWKDRLLDYALDAPAVLDATARSEVEEHVKACPACAEALRTWRGRRQEMDAGLGGLARGGEPPSGFRARTLARIKAAPAPLPWRLAWAGAPAALVLIALAAAWSLYRSGGTSIELRREQWVATRELVEWRSPTESLMRSSLGELLQSTPRLGDFYIPLSPNLAGGKR